MPRGVRAIHGAEVQGDLHGHGHGLHTHISPACPYLAANCWCELAVVMVPQAMVRWEGRTLSCGLPDCVGPDGETEITEIIFDGKGAKGFTPASFPGCTFLIDQLGAVASPDMQARVRRALLHQARRLTRGEPVAPAARVRRSYPSKDQKEATKNTYIALRQEAILQLWDSGLTYRQIAERVGVSVYAVNNDIYAMRTAGILGYRNRMPGTRKKKRNRR